MFVALRWNQDTSYVCNAEENSSNERVSFAVEPLFTRGNFLDLVLQGETQLNLCTMLEKLRDALESPVYKLDATWMDRMVICWVKKIQSQKSSPICCGPTYLIFLK